MSAVLATNDSDDLQALFDSIVAANGAPDTSRPASNDATVEDASALLAKIGHLTRTLHESLRELGYDRMVEEAAASIPDARERLAYVATLTERAAERVLNATDVAKPIQDRLGANASALAERWRKVFSAQAGVEEFKALSESTLAFLDDVPKQTKATGEQLMEIVMAQDFQDLTGQVIKKVTQLVTEVEQNLLKLVVMASKVDRFAGIEHRHDELRAEQSLKKHPSQGEGPQMNADIRQDVVSGQDDVDDLLSSLGF